MIAEIVKRTLLSIGVSEKDFDFKRDEPKRCELRFGYWRRMPDDIIAKLEQELSDMNIEHDIYEDDDGETDDGRTMYRYLHSYIITFKDGNLEIGN